jgi:hypothetical protein
MSPAVWNLLSAKGAALESWGCLDPWGVAPGYYDSAPLALYQY